MPAGIGRVHQHRRFPEPGQSAAAFDLALIENGAYDDYWPAMHMSPEESIRAFQDLKDSTLYRVHNSTFDLAFHPWREPMDRLAALAFARGIDLATPVNGELLTVGKPRVNELWWAKLR